MRPIVFLLLLLFAAPAFAECPEYAPPQGLLIWFECGVLLKACPNGPVTMQVYPSGGGGTGGGATGPVTDTEAPRIQPCDTVTWNFGDGTTETVVGADKMTHVYPAPGNYDVEVTVTNALGSSTAQGSHAIASSPAGIQFVADPSWIDNAPYQRWSCFPCVIAHENDGTVTLTVERSLDLTRASTAEAVVYSSKLPGLAQTYTAPLTFLPGEKQKSFTVPVIDDAVYYGPRAFQLELRHLTGGTQLVQPYTVLEILDDEPRPTLSLTSTELAIREGDSGVTPFTIAAALSAPVQRRVTASLELRPETAKSPSDFSNLGALVSFAAGATATEFTGSIVGDTTPEPDEAFYVRLYASGQPGDPIADQTLVKVTILNDDAGFLQRPVIAAGTTMSLTLDVGAPYATPSVITFTSSNDNVVPTPAPVTIPVGTSRVDVPIRAKAAGVAVIQASAPARTTQPAIVSVIGSVASPKRRATRH